MVTDNWKMHMQKQFVCIKTVYMWAEHICATGNPENCDGSPDFPKTRSKIFPRSITHLGHTRLRQIDRAGVEQRRELVRGSEILARRNAHASSGTQ